MTMAKNVLCPVICIMTMFQAVQGFARVTELVRQIVGLDQTISQHLMFNSSVKSLEICSFHCLHKGCQSLVYDNEGHCSLYDTLLSSNETDEVSELYAIKGIFCYPRGPNMNDVAFGKPVTSSTPYHSYTNGPRLVDGNHNWPCLCTVFADKPYLVIDLLQTYNLNGFYFLNRQDCCPERLFNVWVQVGETLSELKNVVYHEGAIGSECTLILTEVVRGRYVKVYIDGYSSLSLCEMEVYSTD